MQDVLNMVALNRHILICQGGENEIHICCAGQSEFLLRAAPSGARAGRARRLKTARAWPWAAQHSLLKINTKI